MIEEIVEEYRNSREKVHKPKQGNEYNVTDLLMCRRKLELIREGKIPEVKTDNDVYRQSVLSKFIHESVENTLHLMGWLTELSDPILCYFTKEIGSYKLFMRVDAARYDDEGVPVELAEIKCPLWFKSRLPDNWLFQVGMYLNIVESAEKCRLLVFCRNKFHEEVISEAMNGDDVVWLIEHGKTPYFPGECDNCWYKVYCEEIMLK